jgi:hypothetical protein
MGFAPTTPVNSRKGQTLSAVSSVTCRGAHPKFRPQLGYMGYKLLAVGARRQPPIENETPDSIDHRSRIVGTCRRGRKTV